MPHRVLGALVSPEEGSCAFRCVFVAARQPLPLRWSVAYGIAFVRRGVLVRERVDAGGTATVVDVVGPGGVIPLPAAADGGAPGYAAADALVCLCPRRPLRLAIDAGAPMAGQIVGLHAAALERVERIAEARSRGGAVERVAALICALSDTLAPPRTLDLIPAALQQRDLAAVLAMRHESVCRALARLERRGALLRERDGIRLLDRGKLEAS